MLVNTTIPAMAIHNYRTAMFILGCQHRECKQSRLNPEGSLKLRLQWSTLRGRRVGLHLDLREGLEIWALSVYLVCFAHNVFLTYSIVRWIEKENSIATIRRTASRANPPLNKGSHHTPLNGLWTDFFSGQLCEARWISTNSVRTASS
jgi:hypothetical protein